MTVWTISVFVMAFIGNLFIVAIVRSERIYHEKLRVLAMINKLAEEDMKRGARWEWRIEMFNSYLHRGWNDMWADLEFWKPIKSYYRNAPFLKPYKISGN